MPGKPKSANSSGSEGRRDRTSASLRVADAALLVAHRGHGMRLGQLVRPIDSVGCYVPGGRYPLPSTVLMTVDPGAGRRGGTHRGRLAEARERNAGCGLFSRCRRDVPRWRSARDCRARLWHGQHLCVAKIVGPGNIYVTTAKKLVAFDCSIDMLAGPTEAVIVSDKGNRQIHRCRSRRAG